MNYPVWDPAILGGSSFIALISVVHVYIAHFAVGGGLFIWLTDLKALRENNALLDDYLRSYSGFFLLLTMVAGGVTGVGIWFIIGLASPAATSVLIHRFFFAFAVEWTFFIGEIAALLIYHYYFETLKRRDRRTAAFFYFLFAFLSLVAINGVVSFMLTPGRWLETGNFRHGFFNPTFLPSTVFRAFASFMFAGLFGYITVVVMEESLFRSRMMRYCTRWLLFPMAGLAVAGIWYYASIPGENRIVTFTVNPETIPYTHILIGSSVFIFCAGLFFSFRTDPKIQKAITAILVIIGLAWMGGFEYVREISRKPFVINGYMYSNSLLKSDAPGLMRDGVLMHAKWSAIRKITPENKIAAGKELCTLLCLSCHTIDGMKNDLMSRTRGLTCLGMTSQLTGMGGVKSYMPPFAGNRAELEALAEYLVTGLHGLRTNAGPEQYHITPLPPEKIPPFDDRRDRYVLLAWDETGMNFISDGDQYLTILPPGSTLHALLIKRGPAPEIVSRGVKISYAPEEGFGHPERHSRFWEFSEKIAGKRPAPGRGITGTALSGTLVFDENTGRFTAAGIPVLPYGDNGAYNPYPLFSIRAMDEPGGVKLAETMAVLSASTEMGCRNCHGGPWRRKNTPGVSDETARNILALHDRSNRTSLLSRARGGRPAQCRECHADPFLNAKGRPGKLNLSAAIHGFHAHYMPVRGADACALCHPVNPSGSTRAFRGVHRAAGLDCTRCHGSLNDHAISLLNGEKDKRPARILLRNLTPSGPVSREAINPRTPWLNEPDCLACHGDFRKPPAKASGFNRWTKDISELYRNRTDNAGMPCAACHNGTHAEYPARNPYSAQRDSLQPLQYMRTPYTIGADRRCPVCHIEKKDESIHHDNMVRPARIRAVMK